MRDSIASLAAVTLLLAGCSSPDISGAVGDSQLTATRDHAAAASSAEPDARRGPRCYSLRSLGTLGGHYSEPYAINDWGQITGESQTSTGSIPRAFLWSHHRLRDIGPPGAGHSIGLDINDRGDVVGTANGAFLWRDGVRNDLGIPGAARFVNERVQIAGYLGTPTGETHAFFWERGRTIDLGTFGGGFSDVTGLNERGEVAGYAAKASSQIRAFLWRHGTMIDLGSPNGGDSFANAINDRGEVVGSFSTIIPQGYSRHGFLWRKGEIIDLGTLGGEYSFAESINDRGQIVGESSTTSGELHAFLWEHGTMLDLGPGSAVQINNHGEVIGNVENDHPFEWDSGIRTELPTLGAAGRALHINERGQIAGDAQDLLDGVPAVIWEPTWCH